jgi:hypothetical protein
MEDLTDGDECQNFHVSSRFYLFPLIFIIYHWVTAIIGIMPE